ncbi:Acetamidase/Formamidase [Mollisia scopiformis]|uniref:Acetamidase/Formamidase n=1 Tax=Mollisia scopiformis TaxID=149040 RepID=A0A194XAM9_MOLSC|nr:Acetamidase/Formamidase [Mollisia scopiformis]KUJ17226.1 Acetamidase/Formamidase [Mollisia scopiformis]
MSHTHSFHVSKSSVHLKWDNSLPPALTVDSGTEISFDLLDGGYNQFTSTSTASDVPNFNLALGDPAIGPVYVNGAEPGDVLKVEFLNLKTADFGWTAVFPSSLGFGLLHDEFPDPALKIWDLKTHASEGYTEFKSGIHIPIHPFLGVVGIAREQAGEFSTIPPYETGGNIDCRHITVGSTLYLPVKVRGALFSCGDGHAAQGDGEVCGTAIECQMKASVRLTVEKGKSWVTSPHYRTTGEHSVNQARLTGNGEYAVLGIDPDLREASRKALRGAIDWLVGEKGLTREEAYMLCSVCADLRIAEIVDMPNYAVSCGVPLSIFVGET